jgi:hypothetical protein
MKLTAEKINQRLLRQGERPLTADDITIRVEAIVHKPGLQPNAAAFKVASEAFDWNK